MIRRGFIFLFFIIFIQYGYGVITVIKRAGESNPPLYYRGIVGDPQLNSYLATAFKYSGWFDLTNSINDARYIVSGRIFNNILFLKVREGSYDAGFTVKVPIIDKRVTAYRAVDKVLNKIFHIPGICNSKIAFVVELGKFKDIFICNFDGSDVRRITNNKSLTLDPAWGPNNSYLIYTQYVTSYYTDIVAKSLKSGRVSTVTQFPGLNSAASVSPNGKYLAMILSRDRQVELYVVSFIDKRLKRLTHDRAVEGTPCWSPGGRYICYVSDKSGRARLYIYDLANGRSRRIRTIGSEALDPDWSRVSNKIVYSARFGKEYRLAIYDISSGESKEIDIKGGGSWMSPSWAPDGRHIVAERIVNYHSSLYVVDSWTGRYRRLLNYKYNLSAPSWSGLFK